jgi:hypothetical protein
LYRERKLFESEYWSQVGNDYTRHEALAKRLKEKINRIDTEYYRFIYTLAEFAVKGDSESLAACRAASVKDPIGRLLAALVWYLHEGRNDPGSFIASLPRTKDQLAVFWSLDTIYRHGQPNLPSGLPGVALPYGLINRYLTELFKLVTQADPSAVREYFYLYSDADGDYGEFMQDQVAELFKERTELILQNWELFRPYAEKVSAGEGVSREDFQNIRAGFRALCRKRRDRNCTEVLKMFQ